MSRPRILTALHTDIIDNEDSNNGEFEFFLFLYNLGNYPISLRWIYKIRKFFQAFDAKIFLNFSMETW